MDPERQEQIAEAIVLLEEGRSYREAAALTGIPKTTISRYADQAGTELPELADKIRARATELASKAVERMHSRVDVVDDKHLAQWAYTAAKLGGILEQPEGTAGSDLGQLLGRLSSAGNTVSIGVKVEPK